MIRQIFTENAPEPGPYSQAFAIEHRDFLEVRTSGICGDPPKNRSNEKMLDSIEGQTKTALQNIEAIVVEAGGELRHVRHMTVYLRDLDTNWEGFNKTYKRYFESINELPTRAAVGVERLPLPGEGTKVMIEAVAYIPMTYPDVGPGTVEE
jgi:2-iminobutanoate/2-iminopropanoate deaminase